MIYKCENCVNNEDCPEEQTNYQALTKAAQALYDATWGIKERPGPLHCYCTLSVKCDYFVPGKGSDDIGCQTQG